MAAEIGSPAPDFTLYDQDRNEVTLESLKGRKSLVVFIPFPFTGTCEGEVCAIRDRLSDLAGLDAGVVVITAHASSTNKAWAAANGIEYDILADYWPHGAVAQAFGSFNEAIGVAERITYVLDADGIVRDIVASGSFGVAREVDAYTAALAAI